jgi:acyl carrier protein
MMQQVEKQIRAFIAENFLFEDNADSLARDASLLEDGVIDSTGVLELVSFLEEHFGLRVMDEDVVPANFDSINALVGFVVSKGGIEPEQKRAAAG